MKLEDGVVRTAVVVLALVAATWWLRAASSLLVPIAIAVCISYALEPIVAWGSRVLPRLAVTSLLLLAFASGAAGAAYAVRDEAADAVRTLPRAAARLRQTLAGPQQPGLLGELRRALAELRRSADAGQAAGTAEPSGGGGRANPAGGRARAPEAQGASQPGQRAAAQVPVSAPVELLQQSVTSGFTLLGTAMTVFFLVFFLLASGNHFSARVIELAPDAERRETIRRIVEDINAQVQRFLLVRLATAIVVALATWGALAWLGTANAVVWGVLAGAFNSIPYFGPVIVSGGLLAVGLAQSGQLTKALAMSGAALVITSLEGWLLTPPLLGKAERMDATVIFIGLLLWTWLWGAWGTLLAVPMLVVVKSVADHAPGMRPLSRLMAP